MHTKIIAVAWGALTYAMIAGGSPARANDTEPGACHLYGRETAAAAVTMRGSCQNRLVTAVFEAAGRLTLWHQGTVLGQGTPRRINFSGAKSKGYLATTATATFDKAGPAAYLAFFACAYAENRWQCGCTNDDCERPFWQLQAFSHPVPSAVALPPADESLARIRLPQGFQIQEFAGKVENARSLALGQAGTVFVGTRAAGKVYALTDRDGDGRAEQRYVLAEGLDEPNGVAFVNGDLYIAEVSRVWRLTDIEARLDNPPQREEVLSGLPTARSHGWRYLAAGPDEKLYIGIGAPCNVCRSDDRRFATIARFAPDGSGFEVIASGIRNSVGFDWQPRTGELFFTDNGRDRMGDDLPPDELNRLRQMGLDFGFPACHGKAVADPEYGRQSGCSDSEPPLVELGPHVAALGMRFYRGSMFPPEYRGNIFIAEHGSWNRREKIGYRLTRVDLDAAEGSRYSTFVEGFVSGDDVFGRPVDVLELTDGSLLFSDDLRGAIYRITYTPTEAQGAGLAALAKKR